MRTFVLLCAIALAAAPAMSNQLFTFENPTYTPGALAGQDIWTVWGGTGAATVVAGDNGPTLAGQQCVYFTNANGEIRLKGTMPDQVATDKVLTIQYDVKNQSYNSAATTFRVRVYDAQQGFAAIGNMHYDGGGGPASQAWAGTEPDGDPAGWAPGGPGWQDTGWHTVIWKLDYSTMQFISVTFDGVEYLQTGWYFADWNGATAGGIADSADWIELRLIGPDGNNDEWAVDNLTITSSPAGDIPEPGSLLALGSGLIALVPFLRKRK